MPSRPPSPARNGARIPDLDAFTRAERRYLQALGTPLQVQQALRAIPYNGGPGGRTQRTFRGVVRHRTAHCLEAVFFAATILERRGHPPLILDLESQDGLDHVLHLYQRHGRWGAIARSRDYGLHGRRAVFPTVEALVESYLDPYVDGSGRIVAWGTAHLDDLARCDWRLADHNVWAIERALIAMPHRRIRMPSRRYAEMLRRYGDFRAQGGRQTRGAMRSLYGAQVTHWL